MRQTDEIERHYHQRLVTIAQNQRPGPERIEHPSAATLGAKTGEVHAQWMSGRNIDLGRPGYQTRFGHQHETVKFT